MTYQERMSSRNFGTKYPRSQGEIADKYRVFSAMTVLLKDLWPEMLSGLEVNPLNFTKVQCFTC
jgi:hypothetical protein